MTTGDIQIDETVRDIIFDGQGRLLFVDGPELVAQRLRIRLRAHQGEWPPNLSLGIDYLGQVMVKAPDLAVIGALFRAAIVTTPGVDQLLSFELSLQPGRGLLVEFEVSTAEGVIAAVGEVAPGSGLLLWLMTVRPTAGVLSMSALSGGIL
jgi:hypothetical protein